MQLQGEHGTAGVIVFREPRLQPIKIFWSPDGFMMNHSETQKGAHIMQDASDSLGVHNALSPVNSSHGKERRPGIEGDGVTTRRESSSSSPLDLEAFQRSAEL